MISIPLLKQSIKANKNIWMIITIATSLMLATIIFVTGNINVGELRDSFSETFAKSEIESQIKANSIDAFVQVNETAVEMYPEVKDLYDLTTSAIDLYNSIKISGSLSPKEDTIATITTGMSLEQTEKMTPVISALIDQYELASPDLENLIPFKSSFIIEIILSNLEVDTDEQTLQLIHTLSESMIAIYSVNGTLSSEDYSKNTDFP